MYREAGIKHNYSDIAKRYGKDRHTVAAYWRAEGGRPRNRRASRAGSFNAHIEEVAAEKQLPGVTKKGIHEWLLHKYFGEDLAGYNAFTQFMRKNGIAVGASDGPEPHRASRRRPGCSCSSTGRSRSGWRTATASCSSSTCSRRRWAIPAGTYSSGRGPGRPTTWSGACTPRLRGSAACPASRSRTTCPPW